MTKQEYLNELKAELNKNDVADAEDIVSEFEQHFLFKLADGFTEETIASKLGAPAQIAAQFAGIPGEKRHKTGKKAFLVIWLTIIGIFEAMLYAAFLSFIVALFCGSLVPAALGVELIIGINFMNILPPIPYFAAIVFRYRSALSRRYAVSLRAVLLCVSAPDGARKPALEKESAGRRSAAAVADEPAVFAEGAPRYPQHSSMGGAGIRYLVYRRVRDVEPLYALFRILACARLVWISGNCLLIDNDRKATNENGSHYRREFRHRTRRRSGAHAKGLQYHRRRPRRCKMRGRGGTDQKARAESNITFLVGDLMQQREVNRIAQEIHKLLAKENEGRLEVLINNAGCVRSWYTTTEEGYEQQFALNHLAGFLLTHALLSPLRRAEGKVIMTGSESHKNMRMRWKNVMLTHRYHPLTAYKQTKLANILFANGPERPVSW